MDEPTAIAETPAPAVNGGVPNGGGGVPVGQPVADREPLADAAPERKEGLPDLIKEFDAINGVTAPDQAQQQRHDREDAEAWLQREIEQRIAERDAAAEQERQEQAEIAEAIENIQAEDRAAIAHHVAREQARNPDLANLPSEIAEAILQLVVAKMDGGAAAFQNRFDDPAAWAQTLAAARPELDRLAAAMPANTVRTEIEAAVAATRNVGAFQPHFDMPTNAEMWSMNDHQWKAFKRDYAARKGVTL